MALFNRSTPSSDETNDRYVTRDEAANALTELYALRDRVSVLEGLARRAGLLRTESTANRVGESPSYDRSGMPAAAQGEDVPAGRVATPVDLSDNAAMAAVRPDYAAVAFGLSEIKRKVSQVLPSLSTASVSMEDEYTGAVQYFADVFAKADPQFDADTFKRQAGV